MRLGDLPETIRTEAELDELLGRPSEALVEMMARLPGDLMILGAAGKMGVSMADAAVRAVRAAGVKKTVWAASRFSEAGLKDKLEAAGARTHRCDLLDRASVAALPDAPHVIYMAGRKFGTTGSEALTWAMNTVAAAHAAERYAGSRIVAMSTGCVYPLVPLAQVGCREDRPAEPVGEYGQSCLGRERTFQHFCLANKTPTCLVRLNYAVEMRYGVIHDIAATIRAGKPVSLSVPHYNAIWQGDANDHILRALELCAVPCRILNVTGPETLSTRTTALELAALMGRTAEFAGQEGGASLLNDASAAIALFGYPRVPLRRVLRWTAAWVAAGGATLGKPTHFEVDDGKF